MSYWCVQRELGTPTEEGLQIFADKAEEANSRAREGTTANQMASQDPRVRPIVFMRDKTSSVNFHRSVMSATASTTNEHQERWREIVTDPTLRNLPYKIETNERGQIVWSPHKNRHTFRQKAVEKKLDKLLSGGRPSRSWPLSRAAAPNRPMSSGRRTTAWRR